MPKLKDQQDADRQYDPYSNENARNLLRQDDEAGVNAGVDQAEAFANDPKNASQSTADKVRSREETPNTFGFVPPTEGRSSAKSSFIGKLRSRKAATGGIVGTILAFIGAMSIFLTPGIAAVQMKEILTDDLNDQLGAMDMRSAYVMRAKLKDIQSGVCGPGALKINCGYKGFSDRQKLKFEKAGIQVITDGKTTFGRHNVKSLVFTETVGDEARIIKVDNPKDLNRLLGDRMVRTAVRKAFNPKFAGFFDAKWDDFKSRFRLTSGDKLGTGSEDEKRQAVTSAVQGDPLDAQAPDKLPTENDDGSTNDDNKAANDNADRSTSAVNGEAASTKSFISSGATGAVKGIGILGTADVGCTIKNTARAVEAGAKIYRYKQLMAYSMVFLTFADSIKAGTATPDQAEYVGNTLTAVDTDKMIIDETSPVSGETPQKVENPYYGANAFDSAGYKTAMYNDAPTLSARDMQMAVGGGMSLSMLAKVNDTLKRAGSDNTCSVVQNWAVRGGSLIAGVALGVITFGAWTAASVGASVAISMALPILENYLAQMISGTVADGNTNGVDTGNAIFTGAAALMGGMAMARGMKPATKSDLKSYMALNDEVQSEYIAMETEEARKTPFDINNRYSFVGSLARTLLPLKTTSSISMGNSVFSGIGYLLSAPLATATAGAQSAYNEERFSKCSDTGYRELGIDADVFCNVRYTMSDYELGLDTEEVRAQMLAWGQVNDDEEGSAVTDSDYDKWLTECTEREQGWGETESEKPTDGNGADCMNSTESGKQSDYGDDKRLSYFRVYTMDASIIAAMDYELPEAETSTGEQGGSLDLRVATFNAGGDPKADEGRITQMVDTLKKNKPDVVGFQEFNTGWRQGALDSSRVGVNYALYPEKANTNGGTDPLVNAIIYNADKFDVVEGGIMPNLKYFNGAKLNAPYVLLQEKSTGTKLYALNTHDPAKPENADLRLANARQHVTFIKSLKPGIPVVFPGDFNSGYSLRSSGNTTVGNNSDNLTYCILTKNAGLSDAFDLANNRSKKCPNPGNENTVDHIYLSDGITVSKYFRDYGGDVHDSHYADITLAGEGGGDAGWPVDKKYYELDKADFLGAHFANSGTWTNGIDSLAADVGSPPDGSAVYSMLDGTVSKTDLGGHGLAITSKVSGGSVEIAYAHGPRANKNTSYKAGDRILSIGCLGSNCSGGHLHLDMSFTPTGGTKKGVCPQDVFLALEKNQPVNWSELSKKAAAPCGRS